MRTPKPPTGAKPKPKRTRKPKTKAVTVKLSNVTFPDLTKPIPGEAVFSPDMIRCKIRHIYQVAILDYRVFYRGIVP